MSRSPTVSVPAVEGPAPAARVYPVGRWAAGAGEVVAAFGAAAVSVLTLLSLVTLAVKVGVEGKFREGPNASADGS